MTSAATSTDPAIRAFYNVDSSSELDAMNADFTSERAHAKPRTTAVARKLKRVKPARKPSARDGWENVLSVLKRQIEQRGHASAYLTPVEGYEDGDWASDEDGEGDVLSVKIFAISDTSNPVFDCKEYSGSELTISLSDIADIRL
jgi:hypothetical protein